MPSSCRLTARPYITKAGLRAFSWNFSITQCDELLATAVLAGLVLNAARGWWWADPAAGYVLVLYAAREVREIFFPPD
jgi:divalent metal cation (Fe/Co/Zn/Cd) transporter